MANFSTSAAADAFCGVNLAFPARRHPNCVSGADSDARAAADALFPHDICFFCFHFNLPKNGCAAIYAPVFDYRTFLLSEPGVVTMTFSGVTRSAPFAVAAPLNISSTIALNADTISPSVRYSEVPFI